MGTQSSRVLAYVRVSTEQQGESGAGLAAQRERIEGEARHRGWRIAEWCTDVASGKSLTKRPNLERALSDLDEGRASTLVVAKLDRLSRSVVDFATLMERARRNGWNLVVLDLGIDLSTPTGEMVANIMASLGQWERRIISERTRDALAQKKASGVKLGRPLGLPREVENTIGVMRFSGEGYRAIAAELNRLGVPTAQGGATWHASSVRAVCQRLGFSSG